VIGPLFTDALNHLVNQVIFGGSDVKALMTVFRLIPKRFETRLGDVLFKDRADLSLKKETVALPATFIFGKVNRTLLFSFGAGLDQEHQPARFSYL